MKNLEEKANKSFAVEDQAKQKNTELINAVKIENTPFTMVQYDNDKYFLAVGKFKLNDKTYSIEEVKELLETPKWDTITELVGVIIEGYEHFKKEQQTKNN